MGRRLLRLLSASLMLLPPALLTLFKSPRLLKLLLSQVTNGVERGEGRGVVGDWLRLRSGAGAGARPRAGNEGCGTGARAPAGLE